MPRRADDVFIELPVSRSTAGSWRIHLSEESK